MNRIDITKHLGLVNKVIKDLNCQYRNKEEYQEYYDAGIMGLVKGSKAYNGSSTPATYLYSCIRNEITQVFYYKTRMKRLGQPESLNKPIKDDDESTHELQDFIPSEENVEEDFQKKIQYENLYHALDQLKPYEKTIVMRNYGIGYERRTIRQLAHEYHKSRTAIGNTIKRARMKLKNILEQNQDGYEIKRKEKEQKKTLEDIIKENL